MTAFGNEFVSYIANYGYDRVLRILYETFGFSFEKVSIAILVDII